MDITVKDLLINFLLRDARFSRYISRLHTKRNDWLYFDYMKGRNCLAKYSMAMQYQQNVENNHTKVYTDFSYVIIFVY